MGLRNKRILITAGPTWVPIDSVRIIGNTATGETGILLAQNLQRLGAKVTLLLGPVACCGLNKKIRLVRFSYFDELLNSIKKELTSGSYDALIHSAAVSDYRILGRYSGKIKSGRTNFVLKLKPTPKIIDLIKKFDRSVFLAGFKFEPGVKVDTIVKKSRALMSRAGLNLVIGNTIDKRGYSAFIVKARSVSGPYLSKGALVRKLTDCLEDAL